MSAQTEVERFAQDVLNDTAFREELKAFGADQDAVIRHANARGYNFTMDDLQAAAPQGALSDAELEGVAGGVIFFADGQVMLSGTSKGCVYTTAKSLRDGGAILVW